MTQNNGSGLLNRLTEKSKNSRFYLWLLNFFAARTVPFNRPHSFRIVTIDAESVRIELPYKKANLNHIKGIHACALATLCEYATGLTLLKTLDASEYRIILKSINITYHYQAKKNVYAHFHLPQEWVLENIIKPLQDNEAIFSEHKVEIFDTDNVAICTGAINWQIKAWNKVRTK